MGYSDNYLIINMIIKNMIIKNLLNFHFCNDLFSCYKEATPPLVSAASSPTMGDWKFGSAIN